MAGREKKPAVIKKNISAIAKDFDNQLDTSAEKTTPVKSSVAKSEAEKQNTTTTPVGKTKVRAKKAPATAKALKKNLKIKFKAKTKTAKKIKLSKSIFKNKKCIDVKNVTLVKNGIKRKGKQTKGKINKTTIIKNENDKDLPPVLEPMTTLPITKSPKKITKKRTKKEITEEISEPIQIDPKKIKIEPEEKETVDDMINEIAQDLQLDLDTLLKKPAKKIKVTKKPAKPAVKQKKPTTPKKKAEPKGKKNAKKDLIIETLSKDIDIDSDAQSVINKLDLNVSKTVKKKNIKKRRHSIEKFNSVEETTFEQPFALFSPLRRSDSPKTKRNTKIRQSIDTKRLSSYSTRSDSPARILRNGKHRKLKGSQLLDGIENEYKRRRRLCSEVSSNDISKFSDYLSESDSNFSDMTNITENGNGDDSLKDESILTKSDLLRKEILDSITVPSPEELQNLNIKQISTKFTAILKRSLSTETSQISPEILNEDVKPKCEDLVKMIDTNSNDLKTELKTEIEDLPQKTEIPLEIKIEKTEEKETVSSPSEKVPEKLFILDQMKQIFNDANDITEAQKRTTRSSLKRTSKSSISEENIMETVSVAKFYGTEKPDETETQNTSEETQEIEKLDQNENQFEKEQTSSEIIEEKPPEEIIPEEKVIETEIIEPEKVDIHEDLINKLRENTSLSISVKETEFKSKSGSESGESFNGTMENIVNEAIKTLDEDKNDEIAKEETIIEEKLTEESLVKEILTEDSTLKEILTEELPVKEDSNIKEIIEDETIVEEIKNEEPKPMELETVLTEIIETPENLAIKENILNALGLRSLKAAEEAKLKQKTVNKNDVYTGTLKTVIKLNRNVEKKKSKERNPLKMTLQKSKSRSSKDDCDNSKLDGAGRNEENACYKVMKETSSSSNSRHSSDSVGANRKSHYSNRSNLEVDQQSDEGAKSETETGDKKLVIPEKASSFSIHPGRLCSDQCAYCFGKFGLFDTPLHIAQMKSVERQDKIIKNEVYLMRDSCLCDACYRHVDRRLTAGEGASSKRPGGKSGPTVPRPNHCHVIGCHRESSNVLRRKWLLKMRKSITKLVNIDLENPSLHSIPVCSDHYTAVEHLMVCALCKRKLTRNHIHYLASECDTLNSALASESIPVTLTDKPLVCKLCRYFSSLLLKRPTQDSNKNSAEFFKQYKKRLLQCYDIELPEETSETEQTKEKSEKKKNKNKPKTKHLQNENSPTETSKTESTNPTETTDQNRVPSNIENFENSREPSPLIDYETLVPNLSLECSDEEKNQVPQKQTYRKLLPESVREAVEISKIMKVKKNNLIDRLGSNPSISVRQLFQGEEDLPLFANIDFNSAKEKTPEGWERCTTTIQYDTDTKQLWQELQKPYGNQSSFLRHLILLEKYFRNGDLTLSSNASHHAVNYSVSVQNRLRAYDNIPSSSVPMQPLTMLPFNQVKKSQSGIITTREPQNILNAANLPKNTPIPISQLNPNLLTQISVRQKQNNNPPGLISIQTSKKVQKVKFPVTKNWKPTLIPVTQTTTAADRRISGLVQVMSGGKPYHISLQDYNKMCYLKKNQELKKINDAKRTEIISPQLSTALKPKKPVKTLQTTPKQAKEAPATVTSEFSNGAQQENKISPKPIMILPKIPKSLTVIPQTVARKPLKPPSPTLSIIQKPSTSKS